MIDLKDYKEMECPVCNKFHFSMPTNDEIEIYDFRQCAWCGWKNSIYQTEHPDESSEPNGLSLNAYRLDYEEKIKENQEYNYLEANYIPEPHVCPICGKHTFSEKSSFEICPQCGWEDDELMEDEPDKWAGSANDLCLNDYKQRYQRLLSENPNYRYKK